MVGLLGLASLVGCAEEGTDSAALSGGDQSVKGGDSGTHLQATADASDGTCLPDGNTRYELTGVLTSNASAAWADVTVSVDGEAAYSIDEVLPTQFSKDGRIKTYDYTYDVVVPDGPHDLTICFIQPSGKARMTACATVHVDTTCDATQATCTQEGPFGDTVGNHNLCAGMHNSNVEAQVKGDFGDDATLTVSGPNGFGYTVAIPHSGNSCVYHYNWDTRDNNGGVGTYTFTVEGNGNSTTWTAELFCKTK
jgi:hypothetical protein